MKVSNKINNKRTKKKENIVFTSFFANSGICKCFSEIYGNKRQTKRKP